MHELSVCGSIAGIVERRAVGREVRVIHLRIGQLRQIVPDTLAYCWELLSADTALLRETLQRRHCASGSSRVTSRPAWTPTAWPASAPTSR